uniref:Ubiquitin-protein ligase E3 n=1 Tax=Nucleocytoviricota sp. TaxID=2809609 RepID=A0A9E8G6B8_9VIRU|nr:ubiquitin-protein ligase E3 [Nucleocytoviricota sp.]UZT29106.1 ubiquitin-protein ligase E3 [Nucleocytoviricota sp.]
MINIKNLPLDLQEKIYFMRDSSKAIIIQKYWKRKNVYINLVEKFIIYLLTFKNYRYVGIDLSDKYVSKLISFICNNFSINYKSNTSAYLWQEFFYEMEGGLSEYIYSFLQDNEYYKLSTSEYLKLKTKLMRANISIF